MLKFLLKSRLIDMINAIYLYISGMYGNTRAKY